MIRKMELKDYDQAKNLVYQVHSLHFNNRPDIYFDGNPLPIKFFENSLNDENSLNYVYEEEDKVVGLIMISKKNNSSVPIIKSRSTYFIEDIVVDGKYRRKGIGKKLFFFIQDKARKENIDAIELNVWAFNEEAINFYESLGMSVKNMKLEKILTDNNTDLKEMNIVVTNKVD